MNRELVDRFIKESGIDEPMEVVVNCHWIASYEALTKFVELVVRECADVALNTQVEFKEIDAMHRIRDNIKEHFGVE